MSIVEYLLFSTKIKVQNRKNKNGMMLLKNALIVNTGLALEYLSKGKFKATNHRVLE